MDTLTLTDDYGDGEVLVEVLGASPVGGARLATLVRHKGVPQSCFILKVEKVTQLRDYLTAWLEEKETK